MFTLMKTRWMYVSDKFLIGRHPETNELIVWLKGRDTRGIKRVLSLNRMRIEGELQECDGEKYYKVSEVYDGNYTAIVGGVS